MSQSWCNAGPITSILKSRLLQRQSNCNHPDENGIMSANHRLIALSASLPYFLTPHTGVSSHPTWTTSQQAAGFQVDPTTARSAHPGAGVLAQPGNPVNSGREGSFDLSAGKMMLLEREWRQLAPSALLLVSCLAGRLLFQQRSWHSGLFK